MNNMFDQSICSKPQDGVPASEQRASNVTSPTDATLRTTPAWAVGLPNLRPNMAPDEIRLAGQALKKATGRGRPSQFIEEWRDVIIGMFAEGNSVQAIYDYLALNDDRLVIEFKTYKMFNAKLKRDLTLA